MTGDASWWATSISAESARFTVEDLDPCFESLRQRDQEHAEAVRRWAYGFGGHPDWPGLERPPVRLVDLTVA